MVKKGKKRQSKLAILEQDESKVEGPELKKPKSETDSDESFVQVPSAKKIIEEMNQEDSEDEDELEDNVIDDDDVTYQATNEPEIITDIPIAKIPANPEEYPDQKTEEEDRVEEDETEDKEKKEDETEEKEEVEMKDFDQLKIEQSL